MLQERLIPSVGENVQKSSSSKAAAILTRGAYSQYASTARGRERRWRNFFNILIIRIRRTLDDTITQTSKAKRPAVAIPFDSVRCVGYIAWRTRGTTVQVVAASKSIVLESS